MNLFYVTCAGAEQARTLAQTLLTEKLIACANILPTMESLYWWENKIESASESILFIKTVITENLSKELLYKRIQELHPYEVPCILEISVHDINPAYAKWIKENL